MKNGPSWHCPEHMIDYCQDCYGEFGKEHQPLCFNDVPYMLERTEYSDDESECDLAMNALRRAGVLEHRVQTCLNGPGPVTVEERDKALLMLLLAAAEQARQPVQTHTSTRRGRARSGRTRRGRTRRRERDLENN